MQTADYFHATDPTVTFTAGAVIFAEGDPGLEMFGVLDGEVELRQGDQVVERLGVHGVFGEMALVDHAPRSLTAVAVTDCRLAVIDEAQFLWLVHETPKFALRIMANLADRLRALNHLPEGQGAEP